MRAARRDVHENMKIHIAHGRLTTRSATADRGRDAAVFSLSSGALGIRGELEEDSFQSGAAILSGFFDREPIVYGENAYGYPQYNEFSVYAPNALGFRLFWEGAEVRPGGSSVTGFEQTLDTGDGTVSHRYTALGPGGARLRVSFQRCVPLDCPGLLVIRCRAQPCGGSGGVNIRAYLSPGGGAEQTSSDPRKCSAAQGVDTQFRAEGERLVCVKTLTRSGNTVAAAAQCAAMAALRGRAGMIGASTPPTPFRALRSSQNTWSTTGTSRPPFRPFRAVSPGRSRRSFLPTPPPSGRGMTGLAWRRRAESWAR